MMVVLFERLFCTAKTAIPPEAERKEAQSDYAKVCEMPLRFFACIFLRIFAVSFFTINYQLSTLNFLSHTYRPTTFSIHSCLPLLCSGSPFEMAYSLNCSNVILPCSNSFPLPVSKEAYLCFLNSRYSDSPS